MNAEVDALKGLNGLSLLIAKMMLDDMLGVKSDTGNWLAMNRIVNRLRQNLFELTRINRELFEDSKEVYRKMNTQTYSSALLGGTSLMEAGQELSEVRQEMFGDKPEGGPAEWPLHALPADCLCSTWVGKPNPECPVHSYPAPVKTGNREPESQPDGPVAESCDGYKIREGEQ